MKPRSASLILAASFLRTRRAGAINVDCPVRILQGAQDSDVRSRQAFALAHRLSRPQDIARILAPVDEMG